MKKIGLILTFAFAFLLFGFNVKANTINSIDMEIFVSNKGDAKVTEIWDVNLTENTEGYHPYYNLGNSRISNLSVMDETGKVYTYIPVWNINNTFNQKAFKCGIYHDGNEVDLCWGISSYGKKKYTINYNISNFIYNTTDGYQILFWELIPHSMKPSPKKVTIKIFSDKEFSNDLPVWGYGNKDGLAIVSNGAIELESPSGGLKTKQYMTVLAKFPRGYFNTDNKIDKSWSEVFNKAETGAFRESDIFDILKNYTGYAISILLPLLFLYFFALLFAFFDALAELKSRNYTRFLNGRNIVNKDAEMFRDLPFNDNIHLVYLIGCEFDLVKKETDFMGALILEWIKDDSVRIIKKKNIFGFEKLCIELVHEPMDEREHKLYRHLQLAANDNILTRRELKKYCRKNNRSIKNFFEYDRTITYEKLINNSDLVYPGITSGYVSMYNYYPSDLLRQKADQLYGLKKFFKEFKNMEDKSSIDVKLWQEYLIYAQILGVAKQVYKELKAYYPDISYFDLEKSMNIVNSITYSAIASAAFSASISRSFSSFMSSIGSSSGHSYSSGGGGSSSSGGGGGSFGGGGGGGGFR